MSGIYWKIQHEIVSLIFWPSQLKQKIYLHKPNEMKKYKKVLWKKKYFATTLFHIAVYNVVNLFSTTLNSSYYESYISRSHYVKNLFYFVYSLHEFGLIEYITWATYAIWTLDSNLILHIKRQNWPKGKYYKMYSSFSSWYILCFTRGKMHFSIAHRNKIIFTDPCSVVLSKLPFVCIYIQMLGVQVMNKTKQFKTLISENGCWS